jgi:beta-mannosidase
MPDMKFNVIKQVLPVLLIGLLLASCTKKETVVQEIFPNWQFQQHGNTEVYPATVPGVVHTDLLANGLIEDPFFGENEKDQQWIAEATWVYSTKVIPGREMLEKENIELVFEGLDTYADVYLNDSLILAADNMFRTWVVNVKGLLEEGENILSVVFSSPGEINKAKAEALSYALPDERAFTRKSPYHFGWDWGPEFVTCGIWKPVYFRTWNSLRIDHFRIGYPASHDMNPLPLNFSMTIESDQAQDVSIEVIETESGDMASYDIVPLREGMNDITLFGKIEDPGFWWPYGMGAQKMYEFAVKVVGMHATAEISDRIGLREIELIREEDEFGESFYFKVNGYPVFMKGANYVPQDNFLPRVDTARYEALIESVLEANMNMLRVWGGGFYENDIFYDLCDEHGILVWQDFMFACNMYPGDSAFFENVEREAIDNVKRLANHPCIALWCGNNEIDEGWHNWGWQHQLGYSDEDSAKVWADYQELFHNILPSVVQDYGPGTIYWPSSPMTGWGRDEAYTRGDVHYWGVWWGEEPFEMYRTKIGRFASEYGFQGMPPMETIESFGGLIASNSKTQSPNYNVLESHQKHPRGTELIRKYMERDYIVPEDFADYVYISQVLQAEGMAHAFLTHRISRPYNMGTLYWQLNDCWPVTSWAGLDYYGRWKALHYHIKRAYAPIMLSEKEEGGIVSVYAVNDNIFDVEVDFKMETHTFEKRKRVTRDEKVVLPALSSTRIARFPRPLETRGSLVNVSSLSMGDSQLSKSFFYFVPTKEMNLPDPELSYEIIESDAGLMIRIKAEKLARQVFLEARGLDGRFSDNFFDMTAGESREVLFTGTASAAELMEHLRVKSIYNTM